MSRRAAFLDRDGTINERPAPHEYVTSVDEFSLLPGAVEGIVKLARAGYVLTVVSNQRGVALGRMTVDVLTDIEATIQEALAERSVRIEAFRYCLHDTPEGCDCRKPAPGMLTGLAKDLDLDMGRSWMIGDSDTDMAAGRAAGTHTALISADGSAAGRADLVAGSLLEVARRVAQDGAPPASNSATRAL
jgi:D-glycero-D-manno-heptose 1,7-bisphosphate phosphatase